MNDVLAIKKDGDAFVLHTGSPHYVLFNDDLSTENITRIGREIRYSSSYEKEGINVNLVQQVNENEIAIATYERGVEAETLSCGTGATACALVLDFLSELPLNQVKVKVKGGELTLEFERVTSGHYQNIYLSGPATFVFSGEIDV
jgi:diaminopimelate epimerase